ncbi:MAG: hypothetical protein CSA52_00360 [Gammaproteobacteria bacterium]|nr:MAG: hypothetical protein CSB48_12375 [Pseudomonadota bacterium]PIE38934.1 MAG: hypothetical protein CSA52_00360 [Gammaproteobacteria bacterium]
MVIPNSQRGNFDPDEHNIHFICPKPDDLQDLIDLFIQLCLQNNGSLSSRKRASHFDFLTDEEVSAMEQAVKDGYNRPG